MPIITLTSDWGTRDHYTAVVKGTILSKLPGVSIVDITHNIDRFNTHQASFVLRNSYGYFPEGTVHIISINTEASVKQPHTVVYHEKQYFIGADNGIFSLIFDDIPEEIYEVNTYQDSDYFTFSTKDVFAKVACHLASGGKIEEVAVKKSEINKLIPYRPVVDKNSINGMIMYIDSYENLITNIPEKMFREMTKGRKFTILIRGEEISVISKAFSDVAQGDVLAFFGTAGYLVIAMNRGNAAGLLGLGYNDRVRVEFE
jgi:S-adenosylmethionine hydrolase